jgi:hypothetical protein
VLKLDAWRKSHGKGPGEVNPSNEIIEEAMENVGAVVIGRNMFGGGPGPWRCRPHRRPSSCSSQERC